MKLRCENLVKKYGIRTVVKGVSMEINQGEIVGFLGPNGAGKTTSFYMITGQIVPNGGRVFLDDEEITRKVSVTCHKRLPCSGRCPWKTTSCPSWRCQT